MKWLILLLVMLNTHGLLVACLGNCMHIRMQACNLIPVKLAITYIIQIRFLAVLLKLR